MLVVDGEISVKVSVASGSGEGVEYMEQSTHASCKKVRPNVYCVELLARLRGK